MADSYQKIEKIGEGTYGVVYKARHRPTNTLVALKKIKMELEDDGIPATTIREMSALRSLTHPAVVRLYEIVCAKDSLYLVFEYMEVDLRTFLDRMYAQRQRLSDREVRDMSGQLMAGVDYCHAVGILHRDLKPQNILVDKSGALKICDFGLCRAIGVPLRTYTKDIVTLWYRPPELLLGCRHYSRQVDVWSLGCIIAELVLYRPMFPGDSEIDQLYKIFKILGTPNSETFTNLKKLPNYQPTFPVWEPIDMIRLFNNKPDFIDLLKQMLVMDPTRRGDLKKLLKHRFFVC